MKRFIFFFVVFILFLGFLIGQCNGTTETGNLEEETLFLEAPQALESEENGNLLHEGEMANETANNSHREQQIAPTTEFVKNPSSLASQILTRKSYTCSYNETTKNPNWIAWILTKDHVDGNVKRTNYTEDFDVPTPRATNDDYKGSGWSRGHMCPAGDNRWDSVAMQETFLLTNICPQDRSLNSGLWNKIEQDCRTWAKEYGEIYIICGPVYLNQEHETIGTNKIVVPEAFFKVILCLQGKPKAIGFIIRNNKGAKKRDQYINTIDDVERITGYDFFPELADDIENEIEKHADINEW